MIRSLLLGLIRLIYIITVGRFTDYTTESTSINSAQPLSIKLSLWLPHKLTYFLKSLTKL